MVDIETTGTQPNRSGIIQIAAVKFNLKDRSVSPKVFDRCLRMAPHRSWDESTRQWWAKNPQVLDEIVVRGEDPGIVMRDFADFCMDNGGLQMNFWGKPISFDYAFISSYLHDYNQPNPFSYRNANDLNTFLRALYFPNPVDTSDEPKLQGTAHNAIYDTLYQIQLLFHHTDKMKGMDVEFTDITPA